MPRRSAVVAAVLPSASGPSRFETRVRGRPPVRSPRRRAPCRRWRSSSWRPTCPSVPAVSIISSSQAHLTHVGTLSGPGTRPDIRPVGSGPPAEEPAHRPGFPVAFRPTGVGFLGHPVPPGSCAFLTVGRPDTCRYPDPDGVSTFHVHETRPGGVPSRPRDGGALPDRRRIFGRHPPLSSGQSSSPVPLPIHGAQPNGASSRVRLRSPVRPSPCLWPPEGTGALVLHLPELRTPPLPATHVQVGTGLEHWPGTTQPTSTSVGPPSCESTHHTRPRVALRPGCWWRGHAGPRGTARPRHGGPPGAAPAGKRPQVVGVGGAGRVGVAVGGWRRGRWRDRKSTRLNSSH